MTTEPIRVLGSGRVVGGSAGLAIIAEQRKGGRTWIVEEAAAIETAALREEGETIRIDRAKALIRR